ncbi:hypothetical protein [Jannaschia sp. CCS1]|uniref:hypothetical protein n=1 Tax=Jannaschia sp. (strain CCS1) TaxID=290400 RepID=UPI000053AEA2|nr:hypothetical protein [Jannaschia sp. CCS1]ABD54094.1 hypothetical protein Jann_1177 [Jannaschia sp. CCS1]
MNNSNGVECLAWTWGIATLVGCFTAAALWGLGGWTFMQGAFMGVLCLLILGALLTLMMCRGSSGPVQAGTAGENRATAPAAPAASVAVDTAAADRAAAAAAQADAARADAARAAAEKADADAAAKAKADAAAAKAEADTAPAPAPVAATPEAEGEGTRPEALDGPRGGQADDLKKIKGVGPKMEKLCNSLGFYHFDQIAAWTPDEVRWVDQNLEGFKGRVTRDAWVDQARLLASGGETEFSKKVEGGDVY